MRRLLPLFWICGLFACGGDSAGGPQGGGPTPDLPDFLPQPEANSFGAMFPDPEVSPTTVPPEGQRFIVLQAAAGSVSASARVEVINLDREEPAFEVTAEADGSFEVDLTVGDGHRIRVQERSDTRHSLPVDLLVQLPQLASVSLMAAPDESVECLVLEPRQEVRVAGEASLAVTNNCAGEVSLSARLRLDDRGLGLGAVPPAVAAASSAELLLSYGGSGDPETGDVLLLDVGGSESGRYALGVWSLPQ